VFFGCGFASRSAFEFFLPSISSDFESSLISLSYVGGASPLALDRTSHIPPSWTSTFSFLSFQERSINFIVRFGSGKVFTISFLLLLCEVRQWSVCTESPPFPVPFPIFFSLHPRKFWTCFEVPSACMVLRGLRHRVSAFFAPRHASVSSGLSRLDFLSLPLEEQYQVCRVGGMFRRLTCPIPPGIWFSAGEAGDGPPKAWFKSFPSLPHSLFPRMFLSVTVDATKKFFHRNLGSFSHYGVSNTHVPLFLLGFPSVPLSRCLLTFGDCPLLLVL